MARTKHMPWASLSSLLVRPFHFERRYCHSGLGLLCPIVLLSFSHTHREWKYKRLVQDTTYITSENYYLKSLVFPPLNRLNRGTWLDKPKPAMVHFIFAKVRSNENKASLNISRVLSIVVQSTPMSQNAWSNNFLYQAHRVEKAVIQAFIQLFTKSILKKLAYQFQTTFKRFWKVAKAKLEIRRNCLQRLENSVHWDVWLWLDIKLMDRLSLVKSKWYMGKQ